jgi:hypothetical protein
MDDVKTQVHFRIFLKSDEGLPKKRVIASSAETAPVTMLLQATYNHSTSGGAAHNVAAGCPWGSVLSNYYEPWCVGV